MPEDRKQKALVVHQQILKLYPAIQPNLKYKMPTYESENGWIAIGNQKNYWSVYTCSLDKIGPYIQRYPGIKHGKGCINFRKKDELDLDALQQVIKKALG